MTTTIEAGEATKATDGGRRQELRYQLEIFALCGFAIAQPVLDVFGNNLEVFVFRGADRLDVVLFAVAMTVLPWLLVGAAAALTRFGGATVRRAAQVVVLSGLAGLIALHVVKRSTSWRGPALALVALVIAVGFGYAYQRFRLVGLWARYASVAPVIFLALFILVAPTSSLVFPAEARAADIKGTELPRHIVFILFDEFPTGSLVGQDAQLDAARYPNLAQFAGDSTWYRNYTSVTGSTKFAVPATLAGTYPRNVLATAANYPHNLFTMLGGGYDVHADEVITALCPTSVCTSESGGVPALRKLGADAIDVWRQQIALHDSNRQITAGFVEEATEADTAQAQGFNAFQVLSENADSSPTRLSAFLDGIETDKPTVEFLHLLMPHQPWHFYPSGRQYEFPERDPGLRIFVTGRWGPEAWPADLGRQRHLLQVQYVDTLVGGVVADLKERGIYDESLIVLTADHGAAFTPGEELRAGIENANFPAKTYDQIMWSPLLIKAPHQREGVVSDANVQSIDLLPTIADLVGIKMPWKVDGVPAGERRGTKKDFFTSSTVAFSRITLGDRHDVDGREGLQMMLNGNQRNFAPISDRKWGLYRIGPYAPLIGQPLDRMRMGPASPAELVLDQPGAFDSVDPASGTVPGLLIGNIKSGPDTPIAVSVNGTIAGVSTTYSDEGLQGFAVLIPDFLFVKGRNDVRLFAVEGTGANAVLRPARVAGSR